ncbi:retrotransposon gag protein [Cucumis melo var. makuwa]|uniref:Retrotransposon gag protein n=1 Tax=Cucumis melo var. makuwa TaxID=1194695 RepID=A0A5D3DWW7_CUCMM|nr:retrotransposon gag protein [Cucumis melo var. makuwa]
MESSKDGIVLKENSLYDNSDSASRKSKKEAHPNVMSVMMADITVEAAMAEMKRKVNFLNKIVEERDHEIIALREQVRTRETAESSQTPIVKATDKGKNVVQENQPQLQSVSVASLLQFDGKGNPKQHTTHFIETCENASSREDQLVRQFIRSLKGNAFECTRHTVSMMEVTNTKQQKGEPVIDYGLLYILQGIKPCTFEELATRAHDMELSIANRGTKDFPIPKVRKDKKETKNAEKEEVYLFPDLDITDMLEQLVEKQLIQLPEYLEEVAQTNHVAVTIMSEALSPRLIFEQRESLVQFETFEPVVIQFHQKVAPEDSQEKEISIEEDDEGWIVDENLGVVACHAINATEEESILLRSLEEEGVSKDLSRFNVDDLLSFPQETKTILLNALLNLAASNSSPPTATYESTSYCMSIDFSEEDLLLGSKLHNRPLYVSRYVRE